MARTISMHESIGSGGFGKVYRGRVHSSTNPGGCLDSDTKSSINLEVSTQDWIDQDYAIKVIPHRDNRGIECLNEALIMSSFRHPNLLSAESTFTDATSMYIISPLALSDLNQITRCNKDGYVANASELRNWSRQICLGIGCLHHQGIIHGDIKAANILLYSDGTVKVADFTLSFPIRDGIRYNHTVCTYTHRPLEVWNRCDWGLPVDIWSLGCTLFEIRYGKLLFPTQGSVVESEVRDRSINCLTDWIYRRKRLPCPELFSVTFTRASLRIFETGDPHWNSLILSMFESVDSDRPTIFQILTHQYWTAPIDSPLDSKVDSPLDSKVDSPLDSILDSKVDFLIDSTVNIAPSIPSSEIEYTFRRPESIQSVSPMISCRSDLESILRKYTHYPCVIDLSIELYTRCRNLGLPTHRPDSNGRPMISSRSQPYYFGPTRKPTYPTNNLLLACLWIASKVYLRSPLEGCAYESTSRYELLELEQLICSRLDFVVLPSIDASEFPRN